MTSWDSEVRPLCILQSILQSLVLIAGSTTCIVILWDSSGVGDQTPMSSGFLMCLCFLLFTLLVYLKFHNFTFRFWTRSRCGRRIPNSPGLEGLFFSFRKNGFKKRRRTGGRSTPQSKNKQKTNPHKGQKDPHDKARTKYSTVFRERKYKQFTDTGNVPTAEKDPTMVACHQCLKWPPWLQWAAAVPHQPSPASWLRPLLASPPTHRVQNAAKTNSILFFCPAERRCAHWLSCNNGYGNSAAAPSEQTSKFSSQASTSSSRLLSSLPEVSFHPSSFFFLVNHISPLHVCLSLSLQAQPFDGELFQGAPT